MNSIRLGFLLVFASGLVLVQGCNTTSVDVREKQEQSGQQSRNSAGSSGSAGGGGQDQGADSSSNSGQEGANSGEEGIIGADSGQTPPSTAGAPPAPGSATDEGGTGAGPRHIGSAGSGAGHVTPDKNDVADIQDDDIVARQLREQAEQEMDPDLRARLWDEYNRYKAVQ